MQGDAAADDGRYFFFSAPASPVHYILRSPPSSTAAAGAASSSPYFADADCCAAAAAGDFEFAAAHGAGPGAGTKGGVAATMSSAEELFVAGRIRVGCLSPIRQEEEAPPEGRHEDDDVGGCGDEERDGRSPRATRRARSASPTRSPRADGRSAFAEPSDDPFASASTSASSSSSSSSAKNIRRRISLRDLLSRTGGADCAGAADQASSGTAGAEVVTSRLGFWPPSIWPSSRPSKKSSLLPCPAAPQPGRRSTSSDRAAVPTAKRAPPGGSARRTTSLPYRQGLVLGCLGFGARGYGLAKSMHPFPSR